MCHAGSTVGARVLRSSPTGPPSHFMGSSLVSSLGSLAASSHSDSGEDQQAPVPGPADPDFLPAAKDSPAVAPKDTKTKLREKVCLVD